MRNTDQAQPIDAGEVPRIAGVEWQLVSHCRGRDQRIGSSGGLAPRATQRRGDASKNPCRGRVERDRIEIRLRLLQVRLPRRSFVFGTGDERPNRQLCECNGGYRRLSRQDTRIGKARKE